MALFGKSEAEKQAEQQKEAKKEVAREQSAQQMAASDKQAKQQVALQQKKRRENITRWQQHLRDEIERMKHRLRSERENEDGEWVKKQELKYKDGEKVYEEVPPMLNETGIEFIESEVEPLMNRNIINSNFDEQRILKMIRNTLHTLIGTLGNNYDSFEVYGYKKSNMHDVTDTLDTIIDIVKNFITPAPYRALNDGERRHQRTIRSESDVKTYTNPEEDNSGGFLGFGG